MIARLDLGSRIVPYTCNEISRRCQKKEDFLGRILTCDNAIKRQKTDLDFIQIYVCCILGNSWGR